MKIVLKQIDGTVLAPAEAYSWPKSSLFQWINIKWVQNFTVQGSGTIDGQGSKWWSFSQIHQMQVKFQKKRHVNSSLCERN